MIFFYSTTRFDSFRIKTVLILAYSVGAMLFANAERSDIIMIVGVTRRIDNLGRITIPSEIRRSYKLKKNDIVEIIGTDEGILIRIPGIQIIREPVCNLIDDCTEQ